MDGETPTPADDFRVCAIVPTYNNPATLEAVVHGVRRWLDDIFVIDDGSATPGAAVATALGDQGLAFVHRHAQNGGKGAAVKTGFAVAQAQGFTHALQVDADGQHTLEDIGRMLAAARACPAALILGAPQFDASAPRSRLIGRKITKFWIDLETEGPIITDPMCGFRIYPLAAANAVRGTGNRMEFDIEVAVRLRWAGLEVINIPTRVRYLDPQDGGVSHFRLWRDNVRISWAHAKLFNLSLARRLARLGPGSR